MKKFIALCLMLVCVYSLVGCHTKPNVSEEITVDKVVMLHSTDGDATSEKAIITDNATISELLTMHNSLQTRELSRPIADERMWIIFYQEEKIVIEWCISFYEDEGVLMSCSNMLDAGNHIVKGKFDYNRVVELFYASID